MEMISPLRDVSISISTLKEKKKIDTFTCQWHSSMKTIFGGDAVVVAKEIKITSTCDKNTINRQSVGEQDR